MGMSSWKSVVRRVLFSLFFLLPLSHSATAQEIVRYSIPLQDLKVHEVLSVNVVFEFGPDLDRVLLESTSYPEIHGKEVFRGRLQSVAYSMFGALEELPLIPQSVRSRVAFFAANIAKRQVGANASQRLINQSIFTSHDKTYVLEFDLIHGLTFLELDKVYLKPYEIDISYSELLSEYGENGREVHPRYKTLHFGVTVKEDSQPMLNKGLSASPEAIRQFLLKRDTVHNWMFQSFQDDVRGDPRSVSVADAIEDLLMRSLNHSGDPIAAVVEDFKLVDEYLLKQGRVDRTSEVSPMPTSADDIMLALEVRSVMHTWEKQDTWLVKYDPVRTPSAGDFAPLTKDWKKGDNRLVWDTTAFIHAERGMVVFSSPIRGTAVAERPDGKIKMTLNFPNHIDITNEKGALIIPVDLRHFDDEIRRQKALGIQGNSDLGLDILNDALIQRYDPRLAPKSCRDLFSRG